MIPKQYSVLIFLALILIVITQLTRFENEITVTYDNDNMTIRLHNVTGVVHVPNDSFYKINASAGYSMTAISGVAGVQIIDAENKQIYGFSKPVFYLFGRDWLGQMITSRPPDFRKTLGDWSMDRFFSQEIVLYEKPLPSSFTLKVTYIGRGYKILQFKGDEDVWIQISDGYLDSGLGYCSGTCHGLDTMGHESSYTNILRIINFFAEGLLIATILALITLIFRRKK